MCPHPVGDLARAGEPDPGVVRDAVDEVHHGSDPVGLVLPRNMEDERGQAAARDRLVEIAVVRCEQAGGADRVLAGRHPELGE